MQISTFDLLVPHSQSIRWYMFQMEVYTFDLLSHLLNSFDYTLQLDV